MAYRILVADDEAEIREVLRLYLEKEGYEIVEAADGTEAVRLVKEEKIDLALLDIMMPLHRTVRSCHTAHSRFRKPHTAHSYRMAHSHHPAHIQVPPYDS